MNNIDNMLNGVFKPRLNSNKSITQHKTNAKGILSMSSSRLSSIIKQYELNPRGRCQGVCHNAVSELARFFKLSGVPNSSMKVYQIQTVGPDGKPSNHVVLNVKGTFYDPAGKQYFHIHKGNHRSITKRLPSYYKVFKVINVDQYL